MTAYNVWCMLRWHRLFRRHRRMYESGNVSHSFIDPYTWEYKTGQVGQLPQTISFTLLSSNSSSHSRASIHASCINSLARTIRKVPIIPMDQRYFLVSLTGFSGWTHIQPEVETNEMWTYHLKRPKALLKSSGLRITILLQMYLS